MAYASCYHWGEVGTAMNQARGEWMISHVNIILERSQAALHHAKRSLAICEENRYGDFDLAYAYEGMARASALNGELANFKKYHLLAKQAAQQIKGEEDRKIFDGDLISEPWFGMKKATAARQAGRLPSHCAGIFANALDFFPLMTII